MTSFSEESGGVFVFLLATVPNFDAVILSSQAAFQCKLSDCFRVKHSIVSQSAELIERDLKWFSNNSNDDGLHIFQESLYWNGTLWSKGNLGSSSFLYMSHLKNQSF